MVSSQRMAHLSVALLTAIAVSAVGTPAMAASSGVASVSGGTVTYKAAKQRRNTVVVTKSVRTITIDDRVTVRPGKGCKRVKGDKTKVRCTTPETPTAIKVYLGDGNDTFKNKSKIKSFAYGGSGHDQLTGGSGADRLVGDSGNDKIWGGSGDDSLDGGTGHDVIKGGAGNDRIWGQSGNDRLLGDVGHDVLSGGAGNDVLTGQAGNDKEYGDSGNDTFTQVSAGRVDADVLKGGAGRDTVSYATRTKTVWVSTGDIKADDGQSGENDTVHPDVEVLTGGPAWDVLRGHTLYGNDGKDALYGTLLYGGNGDDKLYGTSGDDRLYGGAGNDELNGWSGDDLLEGGTGNDFLGGDDTELETSNPIGRDVIRGGPGTDYVSYNGHSKPVTVNLDGLANDGQAGENDLVGADVENINGSWQSDVLTGNDAANYINGASGDDVIRGGGGNDTLYGNLGADQIYGEAGDDALIDGANYGPTEIDLLDGGDNATALGDICTANGTDTVVACERAGA
jgi:Ca2+-binding RTX toxin-like protein